MKKRNVKFSIEEIVGDVITYDVVMEVNETKKVIFRNISSMKLAQQYKEIAKSVVPQS